MSEPLATRLAAVVLTVLAFSALPAATQEQPASRTTTDVAADVVTKSTLGWQ